jgi:hypothetical protein
MLAELNDAATGNKQKLQHICGSGIQHRLNDISTFEEDAYGLS